MVKHYDNMLSRFYLIQTDRETDGQTELLYINIACQCADTR